MKLRNRRHSPMQAAFDGLNARDAARLAAFLSADLATRSHSESNSPRAGDTTTVTVSEPRKRGRRA